MGEIINLRRKRKQRTRDAEAAQAARNRHAHGLSKSLTDLAAARKDQEKHALDAHKRDPKGDQPASS